MANNAQILVGPQPDFVLMSQNCQNFANEVAKIPNTPQFAVGNDILARLDQINDRLNTVVGEINTRLDTAVGEINTRLDTAVGEINTRLDTAVGEINTRFNTIIQASDYNNVARVSNSLLSASNEPLAELVNPSNNTEVAGFPQTPGHVGTMQAATLTEVLRQLGLRVGGNRSAKEERLRVFIGLKGSPA